MLETLSSQGSVRPRRLLRRTGNPNPTLRWSEHPSATLWRGAASFCISQVSYHVDSGSGPLLHPGPYHFPKGNRASGPPAETIRNVVNRIVRAIRVTSRAKWAQPSEKRPTLLRKQEDHSRIVIRTSRPSEILISLRGQPRMWRKPCIDPKTRLPRRKSTDGQL